MEDLTITEPLTTTEYGMNSIRYTDGADDYFFCEKEGCEPWWSIWTIERVNK